MIKIHENMCMNDFGKDNNIRYWVTTYPLIYILTNAIKKF